MAMRPWLAWLAKKFKHAAVHESFDPFIVAPWVKQASLNVIDNDIIIVTCQLNQWWYQPDAGSPIDTLPQQQGVSICAARDPARGGCAGGEGVFVFPST